ncbi:hypothetical protein BDY24DRAFT_397972 [Mrakia frigida]|uniref:NmrA/HSCARG family protein n=1 Tax=Mrakia frigida TaxID=29902 RepID=UPI003FCC04D4
MSTIISKRILVTGATGKQGGGVVKALVEANSALPASSPNPYTILAVTRTASSAKAQALSKLRGVELIEGNLNDPKDLFAKAANSGGPVYGVFSVQQSFDNKDGGVEGEKKQGKELAAAALEAGVKHFIYSSVDIGGLEKTDIPHFESKQEVEKYIKNVLPTLPLTILRPTYFMDNMLEPTSMQAKIFSTALVYNFSDPSKRIQMIACSDIGLVAGEAFQNADEFIGKTISLAGDEPTIPELQSNFESTMGYPLPLTFSFIATFLKYFVTEIGTMFKFFDVTGYSADVPSLRKRFPKIKNLQQWLEAEVKK